MKIILDIKNSTNIKIPQRKMIISAIVAVLENKKYNGSFEIGLEVVDKLEIKKLNKKYRGHNTTTDVLSFPCYNNPPRNDKNMIPLGDIVICPDCIKENFTILDLIKHSTLHLLGYHHKE